MSDAKAPESGEKRKRRRRRKAPDGSSESSAAANKGPAEATGSAGARPRPEGSRRRRASRSPGPGGKPDQRGRPGQETRRDGRPRPGAGEKRRNRPAGDKRRPDRERDNRPAQSNTSVSSPTPATTRATARPQAAAAVPRALDLEISRDVPASVRWGDDSDAPTRDIPALAADLPANAPESDWDPTSAHLRNQQGFDGPLSARICNVIGVRFVSAGRLYLYDGGDGSYQRGDRVIVEAERGERLGTVGAQSSRQAPPRSLKKVVRRASAADLGPADRNEEQVYLGRAKELAKDMRLGVKVFRASVEQGRLAIYYSCEDKTDVRRLTRALSDALPLPVEMRHFGARDEAKLVGGIGSCGLELCCSTWLPAFVPVSIKNAKDQGLNLNPGKVSGQCGRLKCCLVYEQAQYSEMRKGLPKLGKRVVTNDGHEGRVIEVDVLHQRFRVSLGRGESKVYQKGEAEPMFASQPDGQKKAGSARPRRDQDAPSSSSPSSDNSLSSNGTEQDETQSENKDD